MEEFTKPVEEDRKIGKDKPTYQASSKKTINLLSKHNRTIEVVINRTNYVFSPHEEKTVPADLIDHADFQNMTDYFVIKEGN